MKFLQTYGWSSAQDFGFSLAPSFKYHFGSVSVLVSSIWATVQVLMGFTNYSMIAFMALALAELATGIYASVVVKRNKLQSSKMSRFLIKLFIMLVCLFVLGTFARENKDTVIGELFQWMRDGVFAFTVIEYLVSVLENVSAISGQPNNRLLAALKNKMDSYLGPENKSENHPQK